MGNETCVKRDSKAEKIAFVHDTQRFSAVDSILDNLVTYKNLLKQLFEESNELCKCKASEDIFEKFSEIYFKTLIQTVLKAIHFEKDIHINMRDKQFAKAIYDEFLLRRTIS